MEIIYKNEDVTRFENLKAGDIFMLEEDNTRTYSSNAVYMKMNNPTDNGKAVNLKTGTIHEFYSDAKVMKKEAVLTVK